MTDKELLQGIARAVGGTFSEGAGKRRTGETWDAWEWYGPQGVVWNGVVQHPLTDDAHAFRLAGNRLIDVEFTEVAAGAGSFCYVERYEDHGGDRMKAARYAIARAVVARADA